MTNDTASTMVPRAWDRASPRERAALVVGALVVILAVAWAFVWQPLTRDLDRLREAAPAEGAAVAERAPSIAIDSQNNRVRVTIPAAPLATLVAALDGIRKDVGAFVAEATIIPRVEPGTVRAEVTFAR